MTNRQIDRLQNHATRLTISSFSCYAQQWRCGLVKESVLQLAFVCHWHTHTHTHTHTFNGPFSRTTRVSRYQKGQTNLDFTEVSGSGISWAICKSAPRSRQIATPAPHHSVFTGRMPFLPPNQQRQSTEGNVTHRLINKAISTCSFVHQQRSTHTSCCRQPFACIFLQRARQRTVSCAALRFAVNAA